MASAQEGARINEVVNSPSVPHSTFNLSKKFACTPVFGKNTPFYAIEVVPDDGPIKISPRCDLRSYTLKAPVFGKIKKHVSFYQVPLQSILPFNWEKIVKNPSRGTDVSGSESATGVVPCLDGVNTVISNFPKRLVNAFVVDFALLKEYLNNSAENTHTDSEIVSAVMHFIVRWEMFLSHGNLLSYLGVHYGELIHFNVSSANLKAINFDSFIEFLFSRLSSVNFKVVDDDGTAEIPSGSGVFHFRRCLDFMRQHVGPFAITVQSGSFLKIPADISASHRVSDDSEPLNYGRFCAYQIVNAHYLTNDKIDYVYSADLYRQYISTLVYSIYEDAYGVPEFQRFEFNGIQCPYDWLSGFFMNLVISESSALRFKSNDFWAFYYPFLNAIFGFNYSLRYMDYFVGARPRNLAIGDTSVAVDNNAVQVVDITKNIVKQKFLNAVGRVGQSIEDYSQQIYNKRPEYDWHNPKYLFSFDIDIFNTEIENTGAGQLSQPNSVTSVLHGEFANHEFTFSVDRHSFIIGIEYFDFERFYMTTQERNTMAIDRFDMFIPELQYVGDQELRRSELLAGVEKEQPFGYQLRDMQFKQSFDDCCGGFVDFLPGWLNIYNPFELSTRGYLELTISPEFIRSQPCELDNFYLSLTNVSMAGYFHFVEVWDIKVDSKRPMAYAPQIL